MSKQIFFIIFSLIIKMSGEPLLSTANDFKTHTAYLPRYRYARVCLNNISSNVVPVSLNSTTLLEWKLPANTAYNLSKSYISYSYTIPALAGNFAVSHEAGVSDFAAWAYFGTGGGLGIVDINQVDRYAKVIRSIRTPQVEYLSNDISNLNYPCNQLAQNNLLPFSRDGLTAGTANASTTSYLEPQYLNIAPVVNTAMTVNRYLPLSAFKDTFFGMDKDTMFPSDMFMRFNTQYMHRVGYYTTTPNNPSANVTAFTAGQCPGNFVNVYLYLAVEENRVIVDSLHSSMKSGSMKYLIPYTYVYRFGQAGASTSANFTVTLTRQFGNKLKRIIYVPFNGSETSNLSFDHSNVNGTKVATIQTAIDSRPTTDYSLNCFNPQSAINPAGVAWTYPTNLAGGSISGDDYREAKKFIVGTAIPTYAAYQTNWFYSDSYGMQSELNKTKQVVPDENIEDGLDLTDADHVYSVQINTPFNGQATSNTNGTGMAHYLFALFTRWLIVTQTGVEFGTPNK